MSELDNAYANVPNIPGGAQYPARWTVAAEAFRVRHAGQAELGLPYGKSERQALDLFHPVGTARGLCVFVHGGYWLRFDRSFSTSTPKMHEMLGQLFFVIDVEL